MLLSCCFAIAFGLVGCGEDDPHSAKSLFVAACQKPLGNRANSVEQQKCRCIYSVVDGLPDPYFASTLKEIVIEQNGNMHGIVKELEKLMQAKLADPEINKVFELNSMGEELQTFQDGIDVCIKG
jgi:hypothetical protein